MDNHIKRQRLSLQTLKRIRRVGRFPSQDPAFGMGIPDQQGRRRRFSQIGLTSISGLLLFA